MLSIAGWRDSLMVHVNGTAGRGEHPSPLSLGSRRLARDGTSEPPLSQLTSYHGQDLSLRVDFLSHVNGMHGWLWNLSVCPESRMTSW